MSICKKRGFFNCLFSIDYLIIYRDGKNSCENISSKKEIFSYHNFLNIGFIDTFLSHLNQNLPPSGLLKAIFETFSRPDWRKGQKH